MKEIIKHNENRINELRLKLEESIKNRKKDKDGYNAWKQAVSEFHENYNTLSFPGGQIGR